MNRFEWAVNFQRNNYASYVGCYPILAYFAIINNESIGRECRNFSKSFVVEVHNFILANCFRNKMLMTWSSRFLPVMVFSDVVPNESKGNAKRAEEYYSLPSLQIPGMVTGSHL